MMHYLKVAMPYLMLFLMDHYCLELDFFQFASVAALLLGTDIYAFRRGARLGAFIGVTVALDKVNDLVTKAINGESK
jgi:hypothetical protein